MNPREILTHVRRRKLTAATSSLALVFALSVIGIASGTAQSEKDEREIEEKIPAHLPIKIKLMKPEKIKDLKNEEWLGELEVEVTNTGTKPIYYLYIALSLPDVVTEDGRNIGYVLRYGRIQLVDLTERLLPDDVPILPGESATLKIPGNRVSAWKSFRSKGQLSNPKKLLFRFQMLNFGDGTGFWTTEGVPLPRNKERSSNAFCQEEIIRSQSGRTGTAIISDIGRRWTTRRAQKLIAGRGTCFSSLRGDGLAREKTGRASRRFR